MSLGLAPVIKSFGIYMIAEITAFKLYICVISPWATDKAGAFCYAVLCGKFTVSCYESDFNVLGRGWRKNKALFNTDELAIIEICRCSSKNEVNSAFDFAIIEVVCATSSIRKLLWSCKSAGDYLLVGQGSEEQCVLVTAQNSIFKCYSVSVEI